MTIKEHLSTVIKSMSDFSRQTNMVAINAAIHAGRLGGSEGAPFRVLAGEIQNMSARSIDKLEELDRLVHDIGEMSGLINRAGRQRMLLMKLLNAQLMENEKMTRETVTAFEGNIEVIRNSRINSAQCLPVLDRVDALWRDMLVSLSDRSAEMLANQVDKLIDQINKLLSYYEAFSGQ
ncbi:methyl-accepting chemotaxis protein [Reichenbachiella sp. MSK19-1]|uniref:methyl-accepting chemotaxis protein n=1 Tax=Reichenbachiella sp. MSK19-1 TaxID=1897631 RepID=UPI000E6C792F|nr:methyl-accepting chemotaxis protein [Reichenbachiella sp. MSK19-1]RJE71442.1 hypothetical protein BGP76_04910 [Reichenbachiella sp. MSK19-1]